MTRINPPPAATLLSLTCAGKAGSLMPVIGFFSKYGALAANWGLGLSSSSVKPIQSHWWARLAFFLFQYSKNVTAEMIGYYMIKRILCFSIITPKWHEDSIEDSSRMVKQIRYSCIRTNIVKSPCCAHLTHWAHGHTWKQIEFDYSGFIVSTYFPITSPQTSEAIELWSKVKRP